MPIGGFSGKFYVGRHHVQLIHSGPSAGAIWSATIASRTAASSARRSGSHPRRERAHRLAPWFIL